MAHLLITGAGGPAGIALARQLTGHHLIGVDCADLSGTPAASLFGRLHIGPLATDPDLIPFLAHLVRRLGVDLVIPTVQDELPAMATAHQHVSAPVVSAPLAGVLLAHDKLWTMQALADAGVAVPRTARADDLDRHWPSYPLVLKPRVARGGRGVMVVDTRTELRGLLAEGIDRGMIAQEFAPGAEYAVQLYADPHQPWECIVLAKDALKQGRVGNAAAVHRCPPGTELDIAAVAIAAVEALGLTGPLDIDVRRMPDGRPVVLEVNARFGANSVYAPELLERVLAAHHIAPGVQSCSI